MKYEIKTLSLGEILDQGIGLIRDKFGLLMGIMAVTVIPMQIAVGFLAKEFQPVPGQVPDLPRLFLFLGIVYLLLLTVMPFSNAMVVYATANTYLGRKTSLGDCFWHAMRRWPALIWTTIVMVFAIMGGFILFIIPGIIFAFWFMLAQQVAVLESLNGAPALTRSKALMKGNIGTAFALSLVVGVISYANAFVSKLIPQPYDVIVAAVISGGLTLVSTCTFVVFYFSCRCTLDNFDLEVLANEVASSVDGNASEDAESL